MIRTTVVLVYFAMPPQIGDNREVASAALDFASKWLLASMAVHVCLERARASEALVANLALVLLLRAQRHLGAELAHHRLRRRRHGSTEKRVRARQSPRAGEVDRLGSRAVIGD